MNSELKLNSQIGVVVKWSFFQLRQQSEKVIQTFDTTRLDYFNALYVEVSGSSINHLQMVQNAAAPLLTGTCKHEHVSPVSASLHWLPIYLRIHFKILSGGSELIIMSSLLQRNGHLNSQTVSRAHPTWLQMIPAASCQDYFTSHRRHTVNLFHSEPQRASLTESNPPPLSYLQFEASGSEASA